MTRTLRGVAVAVVLAMGWSGLAVAQDADDYQRGGYWQRGNPDQARQYGYNNGYRDGVNKGREEGRERDPGDYRTPDWRQATRGYRSSMGPVDWFQRGYQEGYRQGFESAYQQTSGEGRGGYEGGYGQPWYTQNDRDRDDGYNRGGGGGWGRGRGNAYNIGYNDGAGVAREDMYKRKPFNPNPRGRYDDADHGYRQEFGNKSQYKSEYSNGYRNGYQAVWGRGRY